MTPDQLEISEQIIYFLGNNLYVLLGIAILFLSRDLIQNILAGFKLKYGSNFNEDDIVYLDGRKARINRIDIWNSVFYMYDRGTKMVVPNDRLKYMTLEKSLPQNNNNSKSDKQLLCD